MTRFLRSKGVQGALVSAVAAVVLLFGDLSPVEVTGALERGIELAGLLGAIWGGYGRMVAKGPIV